jgi:cyanophycinase
MKKHYVITLLLLFSLTNLQCQNKGQDIKYIGPENGSLLIVGGAMKSETIISRFVELAGGLDAAIVVIPTASGLTSYDENSGFAKKLRQLGATHVTVLHTKDKAVANSESFVKPLLKARAVWFGGGRQWRLVDAYKNTLTETLIAQVLERGGVIGGSSAGATIQGSYLVRGDTNNNQIMMGDHEEGFNYLKNVAIDQHVLARNRHFDMFEILKAQPDLLGLGVDENTAIVVQGNQFNVIGENYVVVYDGTFFSREGMELKKLPEKSSLFYFLRSGDKYDLLNRSVTQ